MFIRSALTDKGDDILYKEYYDTDVLSDLDLCMGSLLPHRTYTYNAFSYCSVLGFDNYPSGC